MPKLALPPTCPVSVDVVAYPRRNPSAIAGYAIDPVHAPLPTACNFPFHPEVGSHTSILMSESLDGVSVAATRQNVGKPAKAAPGPPPRAGAPGGTNAPGATSAADVTFTLGRFNVVTISHDAAYACADPRTRMASTDAKKIVRFIRLIAPLGPATAGHHNRALNAA